MQLRARFHRLFHLPNSKDIERCVSLRAQTRALAPLAPSEYASDAERQWTEFRQELRRAVLHKDPRYFLQWPVITHTMFYPGDTVELSTLQQSPLWTVWQTAIRETQIGFPVRYEEYPESSGNLIHHAYALMQLCNATTFKVQKAKTIFEYGGGYGSMARLFYQTGFKGEYTIFDFPEFSILQRFFLTQTCPELNVQLISQTTNIPPGLEPDLFIAAWSLSESSVKDREPMVSLIRRSRCCLIAFQHKFQDVNNEEYFRMMTQNIQNHKWSFAPMSHLPGNSFLFGEMI